MNLRQIIKKLDGIAPFETAEEWDNSGLMVGHPDAEISRAVVALDATRAAIAFARNNHADLIITHHPLIFKPLPNLDLSAVLPDKLATLITSGIAVVSLHTNLDAAAGGVADTLADFLGLQEVEGAGPFRTGRLASAADLGNWAAKIGAARVVDGGRPVLRVGLCPGSGMDYWKQALDSGCDTFVTGDVRYHQALDAQEAGFNVVDLGHFGSEHLIVKPLAAGLRQTLAGIEILEFNAQDIFRTIKRRVKIEKAD